MDRTILENQISIMNALLCLVKDKEMQEELIRKIQYTEARLRAYAA